MLQDRDYMNSSPGVSRQGSFLDNVKNWTAIKTIVVLNVIFFFLQLFLTKKCYLPLQDFIVLKHLDLADPLKNYAEIKDGVEVVYANYSYFKHSLMLSSQSIMKGQLWTVFTHMFAHADFLHIFFNLFVLSSFGKPVEQRLGKIRFFFLYFFSGIIACLTFLAVNWISGTYALGASGAVMGVFMTAALFMPTMQVFFFIIPIPIPIWKFIKWYAGISFALLMMRIFNFDFGPAWAHSAHLGGMLGGWVFVKQFLKMKTPTIDFSKWFSNLKAKKKRDAFTYVKNSKKTGSYTTGEAASSSLEDVDRILDKISNSGIGSLTDKEKATLENARKNLRR